MYFFIRFFPIKDELMNHKMRLTFISRWTRRIAKTYCENNIIDEYFVAFKRYH